MSSDDVVLFSFRLSVLAEVNLQGPNVVFESEHGHGPEKIIAIDGFPLLALAFVGGFAGDEAYELGHAFLDGLLGFFRYLCVGRERFLHDPAHVGDGEEAVLLLRRRSVGRWAADGAILSSFPCHGDSAERS